MNKIKHAKAVEVLKAARKHLAVDSDDQSRHEFLCAAIEAACLRDDSRSEAGEMLRCLIMLRLQGYRTLDMWLRSEHGIRGLYNNKSRKLQATRHAWLDDLIREFSA